MSERKLATIRRINNIKPVDGADKIECAVVDGWCVVVQKNEFKVGELAVFCEIDSWIPTKIAPFLTKKDREPKVFKNIRGELLKTCVIRGQISQGLLLQLSVIPTMVEEGSDVTEILEILKYEVPEISSKVTSNMVTKGEYPTFLRKSNQPRIQNEFNHIIPSWEITEKLDGSSMTVYLYNGNIGVCSHNIEIKEDRQNAFWRAAYDEGLIEKLKSFGKDIAIQGELVGPNIQKNKYKLTRQTFYLFDIFDILRQRYFKPYERRQINDVLGIQHVPIIDNRYVITDDLDNILKLAERKSMINPDTEQEGFVFKCNTGDKSFKVISNKFLLIN